MAREGIARDAIKHLARHSSSAADGYIEEAAEECPSSGMVAMDQMGVARRLENLASVQFGIQRELAATREGQISVEDVERLVRDQIAQSVPALSMSAGSLSPEDVKLLVQDAVAGLVPAQASVPMAVIEIAIDERDLITNGKWRAETIRRMQDFLSEDNSNLEVNGLWDLASGQALQAFLKSQGRYVSFVDGDFGGVSVQSLQAWLRDEGFSCGNDGPRCDGVSGNWTKDTTAALQRFLNSRKASAGVDAPAIWSDEYADLKASCWAMALFGGAENYMEEDALELLPPADVEKGRKAAEARQLLRDSGLAVPFGEWWGAAQLLSNLGSGTWLDAAGSEAAVAAVIALQSLESADEAPEGVFEMGIASLLSHLRVGSMQAVEASCAALGRLADMHLLQVEVHDSARKILALRLRANSAIHAAVARGLTSMKSLVSQLWPVLRERLSCSSDGLDVKIAAEALASLDWERLLPEHVLSSCADILGPRLHEEDWLMRVGACHGLAVFGRKASGPYLDPILQLVDDEEGPVVGAAAYAVSQLMDGRNGRLLGVVRRLQARLPDAESDSWVRAGACQGLGLLGVVDDDTISVLSAHLTDTEVIVVEAAAEALCNLQMMNAIDLKVVEDQARETSKRLHHSDWLTRWAACICLGALGAAAQPYLQERRVKQIGFPASAK
eukprot:s3180_g2.t1